MFVPNGHCCMHQVSNLSGLNEKLNRLAHKLRSENASLQTALEQAAADRKALEAAAALESSRAETSAVVSVAAAHSGRVVDEVVGLVAQQQQLVALVCELREDLLGLVVGEDQGGEMTKVAAAAEAAKTSLLDSGPLAVLGQPEPPASLMHLSTVDASDNAAGSPSGSGNRGAVLAPAGPAGVVPRSHCSRLCGPELAPAGVAGDIAPQDSSTTSSSTGATTISCNPAAAAAAAQAASGCSAEAADSCSPLPMGSCSLAGPQVLHLKSVRGGVDAALAATVADTLLL